MTKVSICIDHLPLPGSVGILRLFCFRKMADPLIRHYVCMRRNVISGNGLELKAVQPDEIETIRQWRNAQMDVLRQSAEITPEKQRHYFQTTIWPDMAVPNPRNILLSIRLNGNLIGYGGLVHVSWENRRAEVSFLLDPQYQQGSLAYHEAFVSYLNLLSQIAFETLNLCKLFTETYDLRHEHIRSLESAGFTREGVLHKHVLIRGSFHDSLIHARFNSDCE